MDDSGLLVTGDECPIQARAVASEWSAPWASQRPRESGPLTTSRLNLSRGLIGQKPSALRISALCAAVLPAARSSTSRFLNASPSLSLLGALPTGESEGLVAPEKGGRPVVSKLHGSPL